MRKILIFILLLLTFALVSCTDGERVSNVCKSTDITLPDGFYAKEIVQLRDGFAVLGFTGEPETDYDSPTRICTLDSDLRIIADFEAGRDIYALTALSDGTLIYASGNEVYSHNGEERLLCEDIGALSEDRFSGIVGLFATEDDRLILVSQSAVLACDKKLAPEFSLGVYFGSVSRAVWLDGEIAIEAIDRSSGQKLLYPIDLEARDFGQPVSLPSLPGTVYPSDYGCYSQNITGIHVSSSDSKASELLCDFLNSDLASSKITAVERIGEDEFLSVYDGKLLVLKPIPDGKVEPRILLRVAGTTIGDYLLECAVEYNRTNDKYRIVVENYGELENGAERLKNEIVSGNAPNIMAFSNHNDLNSYHDQYIEEGLFADLYEFMDDEALKSSPDFSREQIPRGILKAGERNGKLYELITSFYFKALLIKGDNLPDSDMTGWTLREFIDFANSLDGEILISSAPEALLHMLLCTSIEEFVDYEAGSCNFDSELFCDALELAATCETNVNSVLSDKERDYYRESRSYAYINDKIMLYESNNFGAHYLVRDKAKFALDDVRVIGYPDSDANGIMIVPFVSYAIVDSSEYKEEAWNFMKLLLANVGDSVWEDDFSSSKAAISDAFGELSEKAYFFTFSGGMRSGTREQLEKNGYGTDSGVFYEYSQNDIDEMLAILDGDGEVLTYESTIFSIVREEASMYFAGERSLEKTARIIQSRVEVYVSERS